MVLRLTSRHADDSGPRTKPPGVGTGGRHIIVTRTLYKVGILLSCVPGDDDPVGLIYLV